MSGKDEQQEVKRHNSTYTSQRGYGCDVNKLEEIDCEKGEKS